MKKAFKNPTLMFILGAVIFSGITAVVANTISASSITYKETTVEAAIDNLYTKAKPDYTGATTFTPSSTTQTIRTNNKILKSNITINPIPSNYQILNGTANINADKILSGYSAFDNNGNLISGNLSTDCVSGSHVWTQTDTDNGLSLANFTPKKFVVTTINKEINSRYVWYYNESVSSTNFYSIIINTSTITTKAFENTSSFVINNEFKLTFGSTWNGQTIDYMVCK